MLICTHIDDYFMLVSCFTGYVVLDLTSQRLVLINHVLKSLFNAYIQLNAYFGVVLKWQLGNVSCCQA